MGRDPFPSRDSVVVEALVNNVPGDDVQPETGEHVVLRNVWRKPVDVGGWYMRDAAYNLLPIAQGYVIPPGGTLRVYVGPGTNTPDRYYIGRSSSVLNNGGDSIALHRPDHSNRDSVRSSVPRSASISSSSSSAPMTPARNSAVSSLGRGVAMTHSVDRPARRPALISPKSSNPISGAGSSSQPSSSPMPLRLSGSLAGRIHDTAAWSAIQLQDRGRSAVTMGSKLRPFGRPQSQWKRRNSSWSAWKSAPKTSCVSSHCRRVPRF